MEDMKYTYKIQEEYSKKELLFMEKEMLGLYISGHPLENLREQILKETSINTMQMMNLSNGEDVPGFRDGKIVTYAGIISSVKKKYTKRNTIMAFVTIEDLYGYCEVIVFDSVYQKVMDIILEDNVVKIEGKLSLREDEFPKIVANDIKEFSETVQNEPEQETESMPEEKQGTKVLRINITTLGEEQRSKLRGFIRFFNGEKNNIILQIEENGEIKPAGAIYASKEMLEELNKLVGEENVYVGNI